MRKLLYSFLAIIMAGIIAVAPVYAAQKCTLTSVLGNAKCDKDGNKDNKNGSFNCSCDDGEGSSVKQTLNLIVDIMTIGIGILGVIGITIVGIQYLTAGGSEEKVKKAKRRMFEIIIGLVAYVVLYAVLKWLFPTYGS